MFSPKSGQESFPYLLDAALARSRVTVAAVDSITNCVGKFLERLNVVGAVNSIYSLARTKPSCSRRQGSDVSRMAEKTYAAQSAIVASYLLSVSGASLLYTLVPSMPTLFLFEPFSRALRRKAVGDFARVIRLSLSAPE
jgi:hypothetical protein